MECSKPVSFVDEGVSTSALLLDAAITAQHSGYTKLADAAVTARHSGYTKLADAAVTA